MATSTSSSDAEARISSSTSAREAVPYTDVSRRPSKLRFGPCITRNFMSCHPFQRLDQSRARHFHARARAGNSFEQDEPNALAVLLVPLPRGFELVEVQRRGGGKAEAAEHPVVPVHYLVVDQAHLVGHMGRAHHA